ncbi:hypothetical protein O181_021551 [Austropuccinia psidii MF-1]|uniref:Uncharacterized protein n=1 Tax=Austropuccinia psidii MF-1 TaxID=1389203 RepID=A0A9Q3CFP7_9BASI|nr:hypothetical protein [Austropuccinia psidii MF-1]
MPCKQSPWQPTLSSSGTQWSEDLSQKPSQQNEPPIPGPSPSSKPPEDVPTCEPEPEVALTQSAEEPFGKSSLLFLYFYQLFFTPPLTISSSSGYSLLPNHQQQYARCIPLPDSATFPLCDPSLPKPPRTPMPSSPHSHNDALQEFNNLQPTLMIP